MNKNNLLILLSLACSIIIFSSCTSSLIVKKDVHLEELGLKLEFDENIPTDIKIGFMSEFAKFIMKYNNEKHMVRIFDGTNSKESLLNIRIKSTKILENGSEVTGVLLSVVGIGFPYYIAQSRSSIMFAFLGMPFDNTKTMLSFSDDIADKKSGYVQQTFTSASLFKNNMKKKEKHFIRFSQYLKDLCEEIDYNVQKRNPKLIPG